MEKHPIKGSRAREDVGFEMSNLESFPFSRLPWNLQLEVIAELDWDEKVELVNVTSGFQEYFTKNGIFGGHVLVISISTGGKLLFGMKKGLLRDLDVLKNRAMFRHIRSCTRFFLYSDLVMEPIKADLAVKKIVKCFSNLRFVENFYLKATWEPIVQELLELLQFKVARFAELHYSYLESRHWEYLVVNQLSNCEKTFLYLELNDPSIHEFPGMELEKDKEKCKEILDAFKKPGGPGIDEASKITYYRRKMTNDKEMLILVVQLPKRTTPVYD